MKPEVAVRDIFQLRNVIQSQSVEEYRAIVSSMHLNMDDVQHLLATAY